MYADDREHLGLALPAVGGAISAIGGLFGGSKDAGRLSSNAAAYNQALSSPLTPFKDQGIQPTAFLLAKSPTSKGGQGGWATSKAQNDAYSKFSSAKSTLTGKGYTFNADGSVNPPAGQQYGPATGGVASTPFGGPVVAGLSTGPLLLAGAAILGVAMLSRGGRRR